MSVNLSRRQFLGGAAAVPLLVHLGIPVVSDPLPSPYTVFDFYNGLVPPEGWEEVFLQLALNGRVIYQVTGLNTLEVLS